MPLKSTLRKAASTNRHCSTCDRYVITLRFSVDGIPSWSSVVRQGGEKRDWECAGPLFYRRLFRGETLLTKPAKHVPDKPVSVCSIQAAFCQPSSFFGLFIFSCSITSIVPG